MVYLRRGKKGLASEEYREELFDTRYQRLLSRKEYRKVQEVELTWAEKLMEKDREEGREQGREVGLIAGKREALLRQLAAKFDPSPEGATTRVEAIESLEELDSLLERVLTATSFEDMKL